MTCAAFLGYPDGMPRLPNRLRELRELAGLSLDELAERVGAAANTIRRLEIGDPKNKGMHLTVEWMERLAPHLDVMPSDFLRTALLASSKDEVCVAENEPLAFPLISRGLRVYRVTPDGKSMTGAGINPGDLIWVDETPARLSAMHSLDIALIRVRSLRGSQDEDGDINALILRMFVEPDLLLSNGEGMILTGRLTDPRIHVIGVVIRP